MTGIRIQIPSKRVGNSTSVTTTTNIAGQNRTTSPRNMKEDGGNVFRTGEGGMPLRLRPIIRVDRRVKRCITIISVIPMMML